MATKLSKVTERSRSADHPNYSAWNVASTPPFDKLRTLSQLIIILSVWSAWSAVYYGAGFGATSVSFRVFRDALSEVEAWLNSGGGGVMDSFGGQEALLFVVRFIHIVGAVIWVGGIFFLVLVVKPLAADNKDAPNIISTFGKRFRELINIVVIILILSGITLFVGRITIQSVSLIWFSLLGLKLALAVWMFYIIWYQRNLKRVSEPVRSGVRRYLRPLLDYDFQLFIGVSVFFISSALRLV